MYMYLYIDMYTSYVRFKCCNVEGLVAEGNFDRVAAQDFFLGGVGVCGDAVGECVERSAH